MNLLKSLFFLCSRDRGPGKASLHKTRGWNRAFFTVFGLLFAGSPLLAQNPPAAVESKQTASISGTVSTADKTSPAVLPGVTLKLVAAASRRHSIQCGN